MFKLTTHLSKSSAALACIAAAIGLLASSSVLAQDSAKPEPTPEDRLSDPVYMAWISEPAITECINCHYEGPGFSAVVAAGSGSLTPFSRREEMEAWISQDKHTIARRRVEPFSLEQMDEELIKLIDELDRRADQIVAQNPRLRLDRSKIGLKGVPQDWIGTSNQLSRRICEKLWGEGTVDTPEGYQQFHDACLTCHGGVTPGQTKERPEGTFTSAPIGIDCLYCHQDGTESAWEKEHFDSDSWRLAAPEYKSGRGMKDLVNTASQASMCLDCHVGNQSKGMFVTHQMYAAGHPPLPSVEIETFSQEMPQHWQTPAQLYKNLAGTTDKADADRKTYFAVNYPGVTGQIDADQVYWNTRKMILSTLVARKKTVQLYVDSVRSKQWGDYSLYDCAACHHELQSDSQRQARYLASTSSVVAMPRTPGRPRQHEWQSPVLNIAYRFGGQPLYERVVDLEKKLAESFDAQPFGRPEQVAAVCRDLLPVIDQIIQAAERRPVTSSLSQSILIGLTQTGAAEITSYDAARQLVWAIDVIGKELADQPGVLPDEARQHIEQLHQVDQFGLELDLPSGREQSIYPDSLGQDLKRRAAFTPEALASHLKNLAGLIR
ncbi:multiheme c-type cytochrome [Neorhodopirellula pilleata]|nr:multiheme c-type cytochrome [Neorhodopirellula pilleata]